MFTWLGMTMLGSELIMLASAVESEIAIYLTPFILTSSPTAALILEEKANKPIIVNKYLIKAMFCFKYFFMC